MSEARAAAASALAALIAALLLMTSACTRPQAPSMLPERPAVQLADPQAADAPAWPTATPREEGLDEAALQRMLDDLPPPAEHGLRSLLVVRHGRLVLERYWNGFDRNTQIDTMSATKSITALLLGIALDHGLLSLQEPLLQRLRAAYPDVGADKASTTLEHLLLMRSGLDCDDRMPETAGHESKMVRVADRVRFFLQLPVLHPAGTVTAYCSAGVIALGRVIELASGEPLPAFAQRHLFGPLGIEHANWGTFDDGRGTDSSAGLMLRPFEMARIGELVLRQGEWQERRIVSREWIERMTAEHTRINRNKPYGYLWWRERVPHRAGFVDVVFAAGGGGQMIFVVPALDLVIVCTGANFNSPKVQRTLELLRRIVQAAAPGG